MRCIDENAVIKMLNKMDRYTSEELTLCDTDKTFPKNEVFIVDDVYEGLDELPTIEPEQQWIPVSERLPEEGHDVLITKESFKIRGYEQEVIKAKRSADTRSGKIEWWSPEFGTLTNKAVLAWMPLPEPYREEGEE